MSNSPSAFSTNNSLLVALLAAVLLHIGIMLGIQLPKLEAKQKPVSRDIDITLINAPSPKAPEKAEFLAQENQLGAGQQTPKIEPAKPVEKPAPQKTPEKIKPTAQINQTIKTPPEKAKPKPQDKPIIKTPPEKIKPVPEDKPIIKTPPEKVKPVLEEKPIIKPPAEKIKPIVQQNPFGKNAFPVDEVKETVTKKQSTSSSNSSPEPPKKISAASLQQQISQYSAEMQQQPVATPKIKTKSVNQVSANKYVAAQYLKDWETKVERMGDRNYPEAASKPGFSASLAMEVDINADGGIDSMHIVQSSGNPELDEAAKKIVRMSAPFPPLPAALLRELDILKITRVWHFSDQSGLITQ